MIFTDLYGLIDALQLNPYSNYDTWEHLLLNPYLSGNPNPMYKFLSQTMWRSSKNAVIEQVQFQSSISCVNERTFYV